MFHICLIILKRIGQIVAETRLNKLHIIAYSQPLLVLDFTCNKNSASDQSIETFLNTYFNIDRT